MGSVALTGCDSGGSEADPGDDSSEELLLQVTISADGSGSVAYGGTYTLSALSGASMGEITPEDDGTWSLSGQGVGVAMTVDVDGGQSSGVSVVIRAGGTEVKTETVASGEDSIILYYIPD